MRAVAIAVVAIVVLVGGAVFAVRHTSSRLSPEGHYFRLKVGLTYKGSPIDVDIVVGCGVHYAFNTGTGGSTDEVMGMTALRFAARMPEGHAVVIRTIPGLDTRPCRGATTSSGDIPVNWLPLITWHERDDEFAHGIGYMTQEAYENPNAHFGFRRATIEHATRADYEAFQARGPQNLWPPYLSDWISHETEPRITDKSVNIDDLAKNPVSAWPYAGWPVCRSALRIRLTEAQQAKVRALWPSDHPRFWSLLSTHERVQALRLLLTNELTSTSRIQEYDPTKSRQAGAIETYPIRVDNALSELSLGTPANDEYVERVLLEPALLGFAYCDFKAPPQLIEAVTGRKATFNGMRTTCRVGNYTVPNDHGCNDLFWVTFENDQFAVVKNGYLTN